MRKRADKSALYTSQFLEVASSLILFFLQRDMHRIAKLTRRHIEFLGAIALRFHLKLQAAHVDRQQRDNAIAIGFAPALAEKPVAAARFQFDVGVFDRIAVIIKY